MGISVMSVFLEWRRGVCDASELKCGLQQPPNDGRGEAPEETVVPVDARGTSREDELPVEDSAGVC